MRATFDSSVVLTAAETRALEARAFAAGTSEIDLMERAGEAAARAVAAFTAPAPTLVLCGPGNNGGDGYVVARRLAEADWPVRVAALAPPGSATAREAAARWTGPVERIGGETAPAAIVVDALFGIGLTRPIDNATMSAVHRLARAARARIGIDLPSGTATDDGALLTPPVRCDLTVAFAALKPAHLLQPAAAYAGRTVLADIGLDRAESRLTALGQPKLGGLDPATHKYRRGHVLVTGGPAHATGAARLAAAAAFRAGAGYVTLLSPTDALRSNAAHLTAVVLRPADGSAAVAAAFEAPNAHAMVVGPALGVEPETIRAVLDVGKPVVLDADVFTAFATEPEALFAAIRGPAVLTPHEGEFVRLFGVVPGSKVDRARAAAARAGAVVLLKGADTVVASPDGRAAINAHASPYLATAGSGDVLAGIVGAMLARGLDPFDAACAAAWLHGDAGRRGGPGLTAEDLPGLLPRVMADLS